jgi:hypothetical protein
MKRLFSAKGLLAFAVGFYTTFVLQNLWNWFVVPSINVPDISYWQMYGFNLLVITFIEPDLFHMQVLHASLPEEKQRTIEEITGERLWTEVVGPLLFYKLLNRTATLATGWAIHVFLM